MSWPELQNELLAKLPKGVPVTLDVCLEALADVVSDNFVFVEIAPGQRRSMNRVINLLVGVGTDRAKVRQVAQFSNHNEGWVKT